MSVIRTAIDRLRTLGEDCEACFITLIFAFVVFCIFFVSPVFLRVVIWWWGLILG